MVDAACPQLLLNHELALSCKIGTGRSFLPATGRSNRGQKEKLRAAARPEECLQVLL
jgi:hypothetical protein